MRRLPGVFGVLTVSLAACTLGEQPRVGVQSADPKPLILQPAPPSVLVTILDPVRLPESIAAVRTLLPATARTSEHLVVLCQGRTVVSSTAPAAVISTPAPAPPPPLPPNPTTFLKSHQHTQVTEYNQAVTERSAALRTRQQQKVAAWADSVNAQLARTAPRLSSTCRGRGGPAASLALDEAAATLASFHQTGLDAGHRTVIVTLGAAQTPAPPAAIPQDLLGATMIVSGFTGGSREQAAWQSRLLAAGASRAVLLTPGAEPALAGVVNEALDGALVRSLSADVLFDRGSATLQPAAQAPLMHVLRLLISDPAATAVINGHTDDRPTPEGNDVLSTRRAQAVQAWLVARGVAGRRLQVAGHGARFPVAPNSPHGQPANRRVDLVINPGPTG